MAVFSTADNETLTATNRGTPMGELFRRYWIPALQSEDLPRPDCPPVRVQLLGEKLVAFRDSAGRIGLMDEFCAHRRVSLFYGRNEENGLRCTYHGWKYDVTGQCVDLPSEPVATGICQKVKLKSYPCIEQGGVIWTYMGAPDKQPAPPALEWTTVAPEQRYVTRRVQASNYLQAMEGGLDSSHVPFLHREALLSDPIVAGAKGNEYYRDLMPIFVVKPFSGGLLIGARRQADEDSYFWRITPWVMPMFSFVPPRGHHPTHAHAFVPIDDHHCWMWNISFHPRRALSQKELAAMRAGSSIHSPAVPPPGPLPTAENDYLINREAQAAGISYSGIQGVGIQDAALQESMGPIVDRAAEILVATDSGIIQVRRALLEAAKANAEGKEPPGLTTESQQVCSCSIELPMDADFVEGAKHGIFRERLADPVSV